MSTFTCLQLNNKVKHESDINSDITRKIEKWIELNAYFHVLQQVLAAVRFVRFVLLLFICSIIGSHTNIRIAQNSFPSPSLFRRFNRLTTFTYSRDVRFGD